MKIKTIYLLTALYSLCCTALLQSQAPSFCDKEILIAFLQGQKERDEALYVLVEKVLSGIQKSNITIDIENNPHNNNTTHATTDVKTESISRATQNLYTYAQETIPQAYQSTQRSIIANKTRCIAGALVASYITIAGYMHYQYYSAHSQHSWAHWCKHLTLPELVSSDIDALTEKLMLDINTQYINKENVHDTIVPHTTFMHEIDTQITAATNFMYYYPMLNSCYIAPFFGLRETTHNKIKEAHTRLVFIKNIFMKWLNQKSL